MDELIYQLSLTKVPGIGNNLSKVLISYCGSAKKVFFEKKHALLKIPGIGENTANNIVKFKDFSPAETELEFIKKHKIKPIFFLDKEYPYRLKNYEDSPLVLFYLGNADLNKQRVLSVVGTRKSTIYGKQFTEQLIEALVPYDVLIVSGLASGTDTNAHKSALKNNLQTVGVVGHGFHTIFPADNRQLAKEMLKNGALLTEYWYKEVGNKENFPMRNRIVAAMSDALIVVESAEKGGSLITAEWANNYNIDVFSLPGRINDTYSKGCNQLIRENKSAIIDSIPELINTLGYELKSTKKQKQLELLPDLNENEFKVYELLKRGEMPIDQLHYHSKLSMSQLALILLDFEFKGLINSLPGKTYSLK